MEFIAHQRSSFVDQAPDMLWKLFWGTVAFIAIYIVIKIIVNRIQARIIANSLNEDKYNQKNAEFVGRIIFIFLFIFDLLIVFQIVGFDASMIMGGISLSIGFAMETTVENLVAGLFIITNQKIKLGEFTQFLGDLNIMGVIEEINIRYTVIRSFDKRRTIIPNSMVAKTPIRTMKSEPLLRGEFKFIIPRHTPVEQLKQVFIQTVNSNKNILYPEYTSIMINGFNDRGIELKGFFFVSPAKKSPILVARQIKGSLLETTKKFGIEIPYPHMTLTTE